MNNWIALPVVVGQLMMGATHLNWIPFMSRQGGFVLTMPGEPREQTIHRDLPGGQIDRHKFVVEPPGANRVFSVSYFDLPSVAASQPPEVTLAGAASHLESKVAATGKLLSNRHLTLQGFPGREVTLMNRGGMFTVDRTYIANLRLYQIIVVAPGARTMDADMVKFVGSFRFLQKRR